MLSPPRQGENELDKKHGSGPFTSPKKDCPRQPENGMAHPSYAHCAFTAEGDMAIRAANNHNSSVDAVVESAEVVRQKRIVSRSFRCSVVQPAVIVVGKHTHTRLMQAHLYGEWQR